MQYLHAEPTLPTQKVTGKEMILPTVKLKLTEEMFCQFYCKNPETFGNATAAYYAAYGDSYTDKNAKKKEYSYGSVRVKAAQLLTNPNISERCNQLLSELISNEVADRELAWTMVQRVDLGPKIAAIREYNRLKQRFSDDGDIYLQRIQVEVSEAKKRLIAKLFKKHEGDAE